MTTLYKGIIGAVGVTSGIGLTALYKSGSFEKQQVISSLLSSSNKDRRKLVKSSSGAEDGWKQSWKEYREVFNNTGKNPFSLALTKETGSVTSVNATQEFMSACESWESKKVKNIEDEDYQTFLKYCTRNTLMSDLIKENGRQALVKSGTETSDAKWTKVWEEYKKHNIVKTAQSDYWKLNDWANKNGSSTVPVSFMNRCDSELNRSYYDVHGDDYKKVVDWCTEEAPKKP
ncbi:hypothetical protein MHC_04400 [Mycoplasma haemocanis str. Illinois]|uniref:Uncharacterized protein n=1 Tax=Mycoplasma haemocanis (strain Illinois) TaxID=1111676 RepID=H6N7W4_MYCHN|nr:hypothetical protein [Mycoplasma haemocanis]AEW45736.1 hypothetical protein MHC_04400 [Mycoplasma haemocanis str. Illinois]